MPSGISDELQLMSYNLQVSFHDSLINSNACKHATKFCVIQTTDVSDGKVTDFRTNL